MTEKQITKTRRKCGAVLLAICLTLSMLLASTATVCAATPVYFTWPTSIHAITGNWGRESGHASSYHYGIDIDAKYGQKIRAAAPGTVVYAGYSAGYGYHIRIRHANGTETLYAHNSRNVVKKGKKVKRGQVIAYVGSSGFAFGAHLHFAIYKNKNSFDQEFRGHPAASKITYHPRTMLAKHTVTFKSGVTGKTVRNMPSKRTLCHNQYLNIKKLKKPTRTGYTFTGWKRKSNGKTYVKGLYVSTNTTFTAKWKINSYKVTFAPGATDGSVKNMPAAVTKTHGKYLNIKTLTKPTRDGYKFVGWKRADTGTTYVKGIYVKKKLQFTAVWEALPALPAAADTVPAQTTNAAPATSAPAAV